MIRTPLIEKILNTAETNKILVEKLLDGYEKGQAEGESIHITDSANLPMFLKPQGQIIQDTRAGYNLLDAKNKYPDTHKKTGIDFTNNGDGTFSVHGTATEDTSINLGVDLIGTDIVPGEEYSLYSNIPYNVNTFNLSITYGGPDIENQFLIANKEKTIDTKATWATLNLYIPGGQTINIDNAKIMICKGAYDSSKAFELYGPSPSISFPSPIKNVEGNYKILNRNKNYFNFIKNVDKQTYIGITTSCYSNTIKANGTSTKAGKPLNEPIQFLKKGYYKVSINLDRSKVINIDNNKAYAIYIRDSEKNIITSFASNTNINSNISVINLKLDEDITLTAELFVNEAGITFKDLEIKIQIEKVEEGADTDIVEPELKELNLDIPEGIKLYGKEDGFVYLTEEQATELELDGEGWYVYNKWNKLSLNRNESWILNKSKDNIYQYRMRYIDDAMHSIDMFSSIGDAYCNMKTKNSSENGNLINSLLDDNLFTISGNKELVINDTATSLEEFKTKLSSLNMYIVYRTEKPVYTKITDKSFIKQLEELQKVFSHEGITNIDTCSTDDKEKAPLILSVEYLKSQKIINKNLDERITNLEALLLEQ